MTERKENLQRNPCNWCSLENPSYEEFPRLYLGPGEFRDSDSDFSYGVPICGGCGGLGEQFDSDEFKEATKRIMDLRYEYCPTDSDKQSQLTIYDKLNALESIKESVQNLVEIYGPGVEGSYASQIINGALNEHVNPLQEKVDYINELRNKLPTGDPVRDALLPPSIAYFEGNNDKAEQLFNKVIEEHPESSLPHHDYATFLVNARNDFEAALPHYLKATELEPIKALHFFQAGRVLGILKRFDEAIEFVGKTREQEDYEDFLIDQGENIDLSIVALKLLADARKDIN